MQHYVYPWILESFVTLHKDWQAISISNSWYEQLLPDVDSDNNSSWMESTETTPWFVATNIVLALICAAVDLGSSRFQEKVQFPAMEVNSTGSEKPRDPDAVSAVKTAAAV